MDINIKYDLNDIAEKITEQVSEQVSKLYELKICELVTTLKREMSEHARAISDALEIKDVRKRERVKRALTASLDKWTRSVIK